MAGPLQEFKADFFKCLAHPVRIRIVELLRGGEQTVGELQAHLEVDASSVSQQLAVLRAREIVSTRKAGTSVYYHVVDDRIYRILDVARELFEARVSALQDMLAADRESAEVRAVAVRAGSETATATESPAAVASTAPRG